MNKKDRNISIALIVAIALVIGFIVYLVTVPQPNEKFTEFYLLGQDSKAHNYPDKAIAGHPIQVVLGIVNHEHQAASYRVKIKIGNDIVSEYDIGNIEYTQKWEREVQFTPTKVGEKQRVEFYLYRDNETEPYLKDPLRLIIDVSS